MSVHATWSWAFAVAVALVLAVTAGYATNGHPAYDYWEHAAVVGELAARPWNPRHPILDVTAPHAFESPYALAWALLARATGTGATAAMVAAALVNLVLLFAGLRALLSRTSSHPAAASLFALPLLLFGWGRDPWLWSGFFHFEAMVATAAYPSTFAGALVLWGCAWVAAAPLSARRAAWLAVLTAVVLLVHPVTGVVLVASTAALLVARTPLARLPREGAAMAVAVVAGFALATAWPYFPFLDLVTSADNHEFDRHSAVLYMLLGQRTWPLVPMAAAVVWRLLRNRRASFFALALAATAVYAAGAVGREGFGRAISWIGVYLQIGAADAAAAAAAVFVAGKRGRAAALAASVLVVTGVAAAALRPDVIERALPGRDVDVGQALIGDVPRGAVVLSDIETGSPVPAFGGRLVAWRAPLYWVPDHEQRRRDVQVFFSKAASTVQRRAILERWNVSWIFLDSRIRPLERYRDVATLERRDGVYVLMRVRPAATVRGGP